MPTTPITELRGGGIAPELREHMPALPSTTRFESLDRSLENRERIGNEVVIDRPRDELPK